MKNKLLEMQSDIENQIFENFKSNHYTLENPYIILNPYKISPLTALILFETPEELSVEIKVCGKKSEMDLIKKFPAKKTHFIPVYGLSLNESTKIIISTSNNHQKEIHIKTEVDLKNIKLPEILNKKNNSVHNFFYFMSPATTNYPFAIDSWGNIRWFITLNLNFDIHKLSNGNFLMGSDNYLENDYFSKSLFEINPLGQIIKEYHLPAGYHHDTYEMKNKNIVALTNNPNTNTVEDYMDLIDRNTGKIKRSWNFKSILPEKVSGSGSYTEKDWCHANALDIIEELNEVWISSRHLDLIFCFDYNTSELKYMIGDPEGWDEKIVDKFFLKPLDENHQWQYEQHSVRIINQNYVSFFDNGSRKSKNPRHYIKNKDNYSRGVILEINRENMTLKQVFNYGKERGSSFFSPYISNFQYLENYHYIIHSGGIAYKNGETLEDLGIHHLEDEKICLQSTTVEIKNNEVITEIHTNDQIYRCKKYQIY